MVPNPRRQQSSQAVPADQTDSPDRFPLGKGMRRPSRLRSADLRKANGYGAALLNDSQAATRLSVSPATLRSWRCRGIGPAFIKMGNGAKAPVRYSEADLEQFIAQNRHVPSVRAVFEG
jgi:hypothetical protein